MSDKPADALIAHMFAGCVLPCFNRISLGHVDRAVAATAAMREGWVWKNGAWLCPGCATDGD